MRTLLILLLWILVFSALQYLGQRLLQIEIASPLIGSLGIKIYFTVSWGLFAMITLDIFNRRSDE